MAPENRPMRKDELIRHLERDHSEAVKVRISTEAHLWTMDALKELHFMIHLGLGR